MTVKYCNKCGFPMLKVMSVKSTETVYGCGNCHNEEPLDTNKVCRGSTERGRHANCICLYETLPMVLLLREGDEKSGDPQHH